MLLAYAGALLPFQVTGKFRIVLFSLYSACRQHIHKSLQSGQRLPLFHRKGDVSFVLLVNDGKVHLLFVMRSAEVAH